jgi:arginine exporter protein ArgO
MKTPLSAFRLTAVFVSYQSIARSAALAVTVICSPTDMYGRIMFGLFICSSILSDSMVMNSELVGRSLKKELS